MNSVLLLHATTSILFQIDFLCENLEGRCYNAMFSICNHATSHVAGDEILAINGKSLQGMSHDEAINEFRAIKHGPVILRVARRDPAFDLDQDQLVLVKE